MMIKQFNIYVILSLFLIACSQSNSQSSDGKTFVVKCEIQNAPEGKVFLEEISGQNFVTKQTLDVTSDGEFEFEGEIDQPEFYRVRFFDGKFFFLVLEPKEITVKADASNSNLLESIEIEGSNESKIFNNFVLENSKRTTKSKEMQAEYQQRMMSGDPNAQAEFQQKYNDLAIENSDFIKGLIDNNINSIIAPYLASSLDMESEYEYLKGVSDKINEAQSNKYQKALSDRVASLKSLAIGEPAPELELPNPQGEMLKLSDFQGKVVLIDFWASWCRPCRAENPNVVKMYERYKDKDFEIFGVSLDKSKEAWVKAIDNDDITWPQVSDLQFWQSEAARIYQVSSIPRTYLIDKEGKILAKNLRGPALEQKLAEVLGE